jgi:hypothetical protein
MMSSQRLDGLLHASFKKKFEGERRQCAPCVSCQLASPLFVSQNAVMQAPKVETVDKLDGGVAMDFDDGTSVLFSAEFLYQQREHGQVLKPDWNQAER